MRKKMREKMRKKRMSLVVLVILSCTGVAVTVLSGAGGVLAAQAQKVQSGAEKRPVVVIDRPPLRRISDPNPVFNGIAMDVERGEVFLANDNRASGASISVYPTEFPATDDVMEPKRKIAGPKARLGMVCGLSVSPEFREMYFVNNDAGDNLGVFPYEARGNMAPSRELDVPHGAWGVFLDRRHDELFISVEHVNQIIVYPRTARGDANHLRSIQGPRTELADPHGIYVDNEKNEIYVTNHGHARQTRVGEGYALFGQGRWSKLRGSLEEHGRGIVEPLQPSTGKSMPPSITVYSRTASGDIAPLRTIQGSRTGMNLPLGIFLDSVSGQLIVANSGDDSVLFFDRNANGNAAPVRVLKGPATNLKGTSGVFVDTKRNELWVTNWENHTATVYPRTAQGNVAPLRLIRSAPKDAPLASFGQGALEFDPQRNEILVAN
ncbi:MAG: hypothetical protein HYX72_07690 [Acidobacteria bacterium]|nr:hypothetical protein [Acidobacteriota bacterium]